jgi:hypothetical protein
MSNYKAAPEDDLSTHVQNLMPVVRHEFTEANDLRLFSFEEDFTPHLDCPGDCGAYCEPADLGEAVDWALGHKCGSDETAVMAERKD